MEGVVLKLLQWVCFLLVCKSAEAFECHCNFDSTCVDSVCSGALACRIYYQKEEIYQTCITSFLEITECDGTLRQNQGSSVPLHMCCTQDNCNRINVFHELILKAGLTIPSSSTTTSSSTNSTLSLSSSVVILPASSYVSTMSIITSQVTMTSHISCTTCNTSSATSTVLDTTQKIYTTSVTSATVSIEPSVEENSGRPPDYAIGVIAVLAVLLVVFVVVIFVVVFLHFYPRHIIGAMSVESDGTPTCTLSTECGDLDDNIYRDVFEGTTSGSGAGLPLLIQRSVAAQVTLKEVIGKGRFGEVRRGTYKGDQVAVKIFHTKEEASWCHEVDIYQTCLIRHPNILRFIAADNKDVGISTQLWLITEYCDNGSLYDVLQQEALSEDMVLKLCFTAASGLAHLHSDIIGTEGKPAIAHRDIKTRNILVKSDFCCCLADLGLSLRYYRETDKVEEAPTKRVGTRRYLSPEILNDSMNVNNFDGFKRSDMYSFGLVMWEVARRGLCCETCEDYQLPYFDLVSPDPSFEDMRKVVAMEKKRPTIPNRWSQSEVFHSLAQLMEQCWHHDGEARVTALRVKKNLSNLQSIKGKQKGLHSVTRHS